MRMPRLFSLLAFLALPALAASTYQFDTAHTEISFRVRHLGLSKVYGRFTAFKGVLVLDDKDPARSTVDVTIDASSINTENETRDKHLRSPDFFNVAQFPAVTFKSVAVKSVAKGQYEVTGDFTLHGVTRRITLPMTATGFTSTPQETRAGFEGTLTLNRSDYGITYMQAIVGEEVAITLDVEAVRTDPKP